MRAPDRPRAGLTKLRVVETSLDSARDRDRVERVEVKGCVAGDLRKRARIGATNGRSTGHRLEHRQTEPFRQRREHEARGCPVQTVQGPVVHPAEKPDAFAGSLLETRLERGREARHHEQCVGL